ncbi:MAG: hypothetical protein ABI851_12990 [Saprospiraceae bacterium]
MKINTLLFLSFLATMIILSCSKEDCTPSSINENVIGNWSIKTSAFGFSESGTGSFNSDGSFNTVPDDLLISATINGTKLTKMTYKILDSTLVLKVSDPNNSNTSSSLSLDLTKNECDRISFSLSGLGTATFSR